MEVHAEFNCNRLGIDCQNSGTCETDGTCTCATGFAGYDCSVPSGDIDGTGCDTVDCLDQGICYSVAGAGTCLCAEDKKGADCTTNVFDLTCAADKMTLVINPLETGYSGLLRVYEQTDSACSFETDPASTGDLLDTACGGVTQEGTVKIRQFVFQQISGITTSVDQFITTRCGTGDTITKTVQVTEIEFAEDVNLLNQTEGSVPIDADVTFDLMVNGETLNGSITLTDTLEVSADLTDLGKENFKAIRFEDCSAKPETGVAGKTLIVDGCPGELAGLMTAVSVDGTRNYYGLKPFKFDNFDIVIIECTIKVCDIATACDPVTCPSRKKREAGSDTGIKLMSQSFRIDDPFTSSEKELQRDQMLNNMKTCDLAPEMLATVVGLSTALAVVLLICIVLIFKIMLKGPRTHPYEK